MNPADRLKKLLEVATEDRPSSKEVVLLVKTIIATVGESMKGIRAEVSKSDSSSKELFSKANASLSLSIARLERLTESSIKSSSDKWYKELNNEVYKLEEQIKNIPAFDSSPLEAKWSAVVADIESSIREWKQLTPQEIRDGLESLVDDERLDISAIKGIEELEGRIKSIEIRPATSVGGLRGLEVMTNGTSAGIIQYLNLIAGTNITLTLTKVGERNDILIDASGGGSFTKLVATGTVDGSNTVFTFTSPPTMIIVDGGRAMQKVQSDGTVNWTGTTTVTLAIAPNFDIYGF